MISDHPFCGKRITKSLLIKERILGNGTGPVTPTAPELAVLQGSGGIVLHQKKEICTISFPLGSCTMFQAEVDAILAAAKILLSNKVTNQNIDV